MRTRPSSGVEQFYPMAEARLKEAASMYPSARSFFWVQEEPRNMGRGVHALSLRTVTGGAEPGYIGRPEAASPASGYHTSHRQEQEVFLEKAFPEKNR